MQIGYARVSTSRQGESLKTQKAALVAAGCDPQHLYTDTISGTKWSRPELDQAFAYMSEGDTLVVTRLDRLGRNMREAVNTIAELGERGMNGRCLDPQLDTSRPQDRVVTNIMVALAEWERELLVARA
ncbi:recombinase family protein [Micrococcus luteus]|uniref:recombinase family protein n=1 Tax=Micrococcus luteus TaxID=1270 RepID=UPI0020B2F5AC|nr:recombinase family protein [Micrococcus luteus]MCV7494832.1 recombinase family protein [Micrococcus luteus]MCV7541475.1 recombinase family protein [Micrococcus luteus]MCV7630593.1 recombinase family protein [Micrococcus luteus]MCV7744382.1 recombinase family protein [Micrococcus luteus]